MSRWCALKPKTIEAFQTFEFEGSATRSYDLLSRAPRRVSLSVYSARLACESQKLGKASSPFTWRKTEIRPQWPLLHGAAVVSIFCTVGSQQPSGSKAYRCCEAFCVTTTVCCHREALQQLLQEMAPHTGMRPTTSKANYSCGPIGTNGSSGGMLKGLEAPV